MAESAEIPEAKDPFEKRVAMTIAILAVILSFVANFGDNNKTEAILKTNEASNSWGYYQAKSIKENIITSEGDMLSTLYTGSDKTALTTKLAKLDAARERYEKEKAEIKSEAELLVKESKLSEEINDRCDHGALLMQIAIVLCSVAILSRWHAFWFIGMAVGLAGAIVGSSAFCMTNQIKDGESKESHAVTAPAAAGGASDHKPEQHGEPPAK